MSEPGLRDWKRATPADARHWLREARAPWWIAGGWCLELFCGQRTRRHADVDVGCFREDLAEIRAALEQWVAYAAHEGRLSPLGPTELPALEVHSLWCRPEAADQWWLELMLDERDGQDWVFRRCPEIRLPASELVLKDAQGTPFLRPEVELLYKAKHRRPRDETDFQMTLPRLDEAARRWLRNALNTTLPRHPWIAELDRAA